MQFLRVSRRRTDAFPPEAFTPELVGGEGARVKEMYAAGILRQVWARADAGGAAILWEAADESEARRPRVPAPVQGRDAGGCRVRAPQTLRRLRPRKITEHQQ